jgi:cell division transport system permease protein
MNAFLRIFKFAGQHFFRNIWLSLVTITMLTLALLTMDILLTVNLAADAAIKNVENRVDISVTFKVGSEEAEVQRAASYLRSFSEVRDVVVVTPDEAIASFKTKHADEATVLSSLDEVGGNPFGYELVVKANSADDYPMILEALDNPSFRDQIESKDFSNHEAVLSRLAEAAAKARWFGLALFVLFLAIAVLIVFNTVRVTIFVHREEIAIMRLVGAAGWFIRLPYLLEALLFSFFAALLSAAVMIPAALALDPFFASYFESAAVLRGFFVSQALLVFALEFIGAALVCLVSTAVAMRKYLQI